MQNTGDRRVESFRIVYSAFGVGSASQQLLGSRLLYSVFCILRRSPIIAAARKAS